MSALMAELEVERVEIERALRELEQRQAEAAAVLGSPMEPHDVPRTSSSRSSPAYGLRAVQSTENVPTLDLSAEEHRSEHHFFPVPLQSTDTYTGEKAQTAEYSFGESHQSSHVADHGPADHSQASATTKPRETDYHTADVSKTANDPTSPHSMHEFTAPTSEPPVENTAFVRGVGDVASNTRSAPLTGASTKPPPSGRRVLFVYPRNMDAESVVRCAECARQTILHDTDVISLIWAGRATPESTGDSLVLPATQESPGEDTIAAIGECSTSVAKVFQSRVLSTHSAGTAGLKAYPNSEIRWVLQQEFQDPECAALVLLPCSPGSADFAMEKFVIEHSPVPVALVRCPPVVSD